MNEQQKVLESIQRTCNNTWWLVVILIIFTLIKALK